MSLRPIGTGTYPVLEVTYVPKKNKKKNFFSRQKKLNSLNSQVMQGLQPVRLYPWACYTGRPPGRASMESEFNEGGFTAFRRFTPWLNLTHTSRKSNREQEKEKKNYEKLSQANRKLERAGRSQHGYSQHGFCPLSPCLSTSTTNG